MNLVYYTVGFDPGYLDLLYLSIRSLRTHNATDVMVICDEILVDRCSEKLKEFKVRIVPCADSTSAMNSSMKKLQIFNYDISKYSKILFIDSDILVDLRLDTIFDKVIGEKLYAAYEHKELGFHAHEEFSLLNYTKPDFDFFMKHRIRPFNCGLFACLNTDAMKTHFSNILDMVKNHTGQCHYEQSFMNVYFNKLNLTDTNVINEKNYLLNFELRSFSAVHLSWMTSQFKHKLIHFSLARGANAKLKEMLWWNNKFLQ